MPLWLTACMLALASLAISSSSVSAAAPYEAFDLEFRSRLQEAGIPGGAYAIVANGRIVAANGYGVRRLGESERVDADTVFRTASVSKTFTAVLTALLVTENRLRWDDPLTRFLPDFQLGRNGGARGLQLQHLIGQSTGVVPNAYDNLLEDNVPLARILPQFRSVEPHCAPGRCYSYQNILFSLIEPAIEQATGQTFPDLLDSRLFQPLAMSDTSTGMDAYLAAGNRAHPHIRRQGVWLGAEVEPGYYRTAPAAGINASVRDLGRWLIAQMGHQPEVLPPQVVAEVTQKRVHTPRELRRPAWQDTLTDAHYGLGWRIYDLDGRTLVMHSGWVKGFVSDIAYSPDRGIGLALLLNGESRVATDIAAGFWRFGPGKSSGTPTITESP